MNDYQYNGFCDILIGIREELAELRRVTQENNNIRIEYTDKGAKDWYIPPVTCGGSSDGKGGE
jgi:hypothetical protein